MITIQKISSIKIEGDVLTIYSGQQTYKWKIADISKRLSEASESEKNDFIISPAGYGIHWPQIDEDLSLNGLLNKRQ